MTTTFTFANAWLAWRLGGFQMKHPDLAVRLLPSNDMVDLRGGDADVAIRSGDGDWDGLEAHLLLPITFTPWPARTFLRKSSANSAGPSSLRIYPTCR